MKISLYYVACLMLVLCSCSSCKEDCGTGELEFNLPLKAYGIKDTLNIGDTIRIRLDIPDKMPERSSGYVYDLINYNFKLITYVVKIDSTVATGNSQETFDWITLQGESKYLSGVFLVLPIYSNGYYQYEVSIVAKQRGLFVFGMNSDASRASPLAKIEGPCSKRPVAAYMKLENDTNVNFEFLKQSPDPSQANTTRKRFDEFAGFCFYVQ